jgi:hypothetical protein
MSKKGKQGDNPLVDAILAQHVPLDVKLSELVGTYLESNQNTHDPLNKGGAAGGFQIQLGAHPGVTAKEAENPHFATRFMRHSYEEAVKRVGPGLFKTDPERAAEEAAYYAERPAATYYKKQGRTRVAEALETSEDEIVHQGDTGLGVGTTGSSGTGLVTAPVVVTKAAEAAADRLYKAGLRGHDLVEALALIGQETHGTYRPSAVTALINDYQQHIPLTKVPGEATGAWERYVAQALKNLKASGHPTAFHFENQDPGNTVHKPGLGDIPGEIGGVVEGGAKGALDAVDSVPKLIGWLTDPDHLLQVGLVVVGVVILIIGFAKVANISPPKIIPLPV